MNKWVQFDLFVFAHAVLELMEASQEWGPDTLGAIASLAEERCLAFGDDQGSFRRFTRVKACARRVPPGLRPSGPTEGGAS
jgi:hypothetical protein